MLNIVCIAEQEKNIQPGIGTNSQLSKFTNKTRHIVFISCICAGIERMETETGQIYWNGELKRCLSHLEGVDERYRESDQRQLAELNTRNK